ncbi:MAG TPA: hypothetical protein VGD95_05520, partial [Micavibrio sp.]
TAPAGLKAPQNFHDVAGHQTNHQPTTPPPSDRIKLSDLPLKLSNNPQAHLLWAKYNWQKTLDETAPASERFQHLMDMARNFIASQVDPQTFRQQIGLTEELYAKVTNDIVHKTAQQYEYELSRTAPRDTVGQYVLLTNLRMITEHIGANSPSEAAKKAAADKIADFEIQIAAIADEAMVQGYHEARKYLVSTPQTDAEWKRYQDSYLAMGSSLNGFTSAMDTSGPLNHGRQGIDKGTINQIVQRHSYMQEAYHAFKISKEDPGVENSAYINPFGGPNLTPRATPGQ